MRLFALTHPTATLARGIENLVIQENNHSNLFVKVGCGVTSRLISSTVFPVFLLLELTFKRVPKMLLAIGTDKYAKKSEKALKYLKAIVPSIILGAYSPEGMPNFFLKRRVSNKEVRPFGVENVFGKVVDRVDYPRSASEVQGIVKSAAKNGQQVSIIGAGMSQGVQTVPTQSNHRVIHTAHLNHVKVNLEDNSVVVGAGATWEKVQLALDKVGKSCIVKQASDIFSIGGSIGINCHGWAHEYGAISSTVKSMKIVDATGDIRILNRPRPGVAFEELSDDEKLFKCMFGTLGYFGVVLEATLDIVDNDLMIAEMININRDQFEETYQSRIKGRDIPLFGGRLILDSMQGDPMREICMMTYRKVNAFKLRENERIAEEKKLGTSTQRIFLNLISQLPDQYANRLISFFWEHEKANMLARTVLTRNDALHPPIKAFNMFHNSNIDAQWLQEYFIEKERLPNFLRFLGAELKANDVRLINATIRPTPKDEISILPYAEKDRYAVVICFSQKKSDAQIEKTKKWIENVNEYLASENGVFYQAYMPYATVEQFEKCYGVERVNKMRQMKEYFDPKHVFGNVHTAKYYKK